jgi:G:T-mismatch repair DNA endonuclease (very short patch repair protein)
MRYTEDELRHLYLDERLSSCQISKQLGIPLATICCALQRFNIPRRNPCEARKGKHYSPITEFKKGVCLYPAKKGTRPKSCGWNKGLTKETDPRIQSQAQKVSQKLKGGSHRDARYALDRELYYELYWTEGISLQSIADKLGCCLETVAYYFKKYQIPRRISFEAQRRKPTAPELKLAALMEKHKLPYRYVGNGAVWFEGYNPDFINVNGAKGIIELFGDYWHTSKVKAWRETESGKQYHFAKFGFKTLILWESELRNERAVVNKIKTFTKGLSGVL